MDEQAGAPRGQWHEDLARIDGQHQVLQAGTKQFLALLEESRPQAEATRALAELVALLELHFHTEELLMGRAGFPEQHAHSLLHQACLQQVRGVLGELELGTRRPLAELRELIQVWIHDHMDRQDQRFEAFLKHKRPT
ncbi:MAG: hemerythrin family protein [Candidatus Delongbacteria bacterium]